MKYRYCFFYATFPGGRERKKGSMLHETRKFEFLCDMARQPYPPADRTDSKAVEPFRLLHRNFTKNSHKNEKTPIDNLLEADIINNVSTHG